MTNIRTENIVVVLIGPGAGGDAPGSGFVNGRLIHISGSNRSCATSSRPPPRSTPSEFAGENAELAALSKVAQSTMLDAGAKLVAGIR